MWQRSDVEQAIVDFPSDAEDALGAIQLDPSAKRLSADGFRLAAEVLGRQPERVWVDSLEDRGLLPGFARALAVRGVPIDLGPISVGETNIPNKALSRFATAAAAFGCRINKNGAFAGSGVLVGPTTVLTAWHVVARAKPKDKQEPYPKIEVVLSDERTVEAHLPSLYSSPCGDDEYDDRFPASDADVATAHDFAVLRLAKPAGALLGTAAVPPAPPTYANRAVLLVHYPEGKDVGIGTGSICKVPGLSARWSHLIGTKEGSSGGGAFDSSLSLMGIHQGKDPEKRGRLVPISRFYDDLRAAVANDQAPDRIWSLDHSPEGEFVIGRQRFFEAFAAAHRNPRVRGIRVKRAKAAGDLGGLPFSFRMIELLVARSPALRLIRLSLEAQVKDIADEIARRSAAAGIDIGAIDPAPGVANGDTAPEAVGADRGRRAATLINQKAAELGVRLWVFIDHPQIEFGDEARAALEGFIDSAVQCDNVRLVIAGYEAVALPGQDFYDEPYPTDQGLRGFLVEILTGFRRFDVELFLTDALQASGRTMSAERKVEIVNEALDGLANENGVYSPWAGADVAERLRPHIRKLFAKVAA